MPKRHLNAILPVHSPGWLGSDLASLGSDLANLTQDFRRPSQVSGRLNQDLADSMRDFRRRTQVPGRLNHDLADVTQDLRRPSQNEPRVIQPVAFLGHDPTQVARPKRPLQWDGLSIMILLPRVS